RRCAHDLHQAVQAHEAAAGRQSNLSGSTGGDVVAGGIARDVEPRDYAEVAAVRVDQADRHVVVVVHAVVVKARDLIVAAHHQSERGRDLLGIDTKVSGPRAIDHDAKLGLVKLQCG